MSWTVGRDLLLRQLLPARQRLPPHYLLSFYSSDYAKLPQDSWVSARFSCNDDSTLFLGGDYGHIVVMDATPGRESRDAIKYFFKAHHGLVMDVVPVPGRADEILSISGEDIKIWRLGTVIQASDFTGHLKSVRCVSFAPENSNIFATGGRDGAVLLWDRRLCPLKRKNGSIYNRPAGQCLDLHLEKTAPQGVRAPGASPRLTPGRARSSSRLPPSITSLRYQDDHTLITASESANSGILIWDTRKMTSRGEPKPLRILQLPKFNMQSRDRGVASMSLCRYNSSLFVACTDSCIYEFAVCCNGKGDSLKPVRSFTGATMMDGDFYMQVAASPISDHILSCSGDSQALIWDLQGGRKQQGVFSNSLPRTRPSFSLTGHTGKVVNVAWSREASLIASVDENSDVRIWSAATPSSSSLDELEEEQGCRFERIQRYEARSDEERATGLLDNISLQPPRTPGLFCSPSKSAQREKRKAPFTSPFKSGGLPSKITRTGLPGRGSSSNSKTTGAFSYRYPTENLPNAVYERFIREQRKSEIQKENIGENIKKDAPAPHETNFSKPAGTGKVIVTRKSGRNVARNIMDYFNKRNF